MEGSAEQRRVDPGAAEHNPGLSILHLIPLSKGRSLLPESHPSTRHICISKILIQNRLTESDLRKTKHIRPHKIPLD